jgi:hypothetical protein
MREAATSTLLVLLIAMSGASGEAVAQLWAEGGFGGTSYQMPDAAVEWDSAMLGLRYDGPFRAEATAGIPLDSLGAYWAAADLGGKWRTGYSRTLGMDGSLQLYRYGSTGVEAPGGWGAVASVSPAVGAAVGANVTVEATAGPTFLIDERDGETTTRAVYSGGLQMTVSGPAGTYVEGTARYVRSDGSGYPFGGVTVARTAAKGGVWGRFGYWSSEMIDGPEWGLGGYLNLGPSVQLHASFRDESNDPIYWNLPRRSWAAGASFALRRPVSLPPEPVVQVRGQLVTIRVSRDEFASAPSIAGTFNEWSPRPMEAEGAFWVATFSAPPGIHHYSFQRANGEWGLPQSVTQRVPDGFGGENGVIIVR